MEEQKTEQAPQPDSGAKPKKKKNGFKRFIYFIIIVFLIWWFGNYTIAYPKFTVCSDKVSSEFKIAVMSDMHASDFSISNKRIVSGINKLSPDIVCILGDMYSNGSSEELMMRPVDLAEEIINDGYTVYFVPGEHDSDEKYLDALESVGVHVMDYTEEYIDINGNTVQILGIDNVYYSGTFDLNNAFTVNSGCFTLLLAHIPNYKAFADFGADLTLCGDTHGGIIQLPFGKGPVYYSESGSWFPEIFVTRSDIYDKGLFPYTDGTMFITSGLGNYPVPARFNNRPEIALITVTPD